MTVVVVILLPVVLAYQTWTYYVFRRRVSRQEFELPAPPPETTPEPAAPPASPPVRAGAAGWLSRVARRG
jgi:cytochrome d ubiquinol oxidase subunit II